MGDREQQHDARTPPGGDESGGVPRMPDVLREPVKDPRLARKPERPFMFSKGPVGKVWAIGMDFGAFVAGGAVLGFVLDYFLKTSPIFLLILCGTGLVVGFSNFVRQSLAINRSMSAGGRRGSRADDSEGRGPGG